jgi:hypothetical protein
MGDRFGRDGAIAADPILDHELLAERLAHSLARHDFHVAARREQKTRRDKRARAAHFCV